MQHLLTTILALAPAVLGHGIIVTPPARGIGNATQAACGASLALAVRQDNTSYVEQLVKLSATDAGYHAPECNLFLCKGLQFADNAANVQSWTAGQVVPLNISMRIPHLGSANVSIVDTRSNEVVGDWLKYWPSGYSPGKKESDVPIDQRQFSITVPAGLETRCANAGDCVLQWWWFYDATKTYGIVETFESCVDFTIAKPAYRHRSIRQ